MGVERCKAGRKGEEEKGAGMNEERKWRIREKQEL